MARYCLQFATRILRTKKAGEAFICITFVDLSFSLFLLFLSDNKIYTLNNLHENNSINGGGVHVQTVSCVHVAVATARTAHTHTHTHEAIWESSGPFPFCANCKRWIYSTCMVRYVYTHTTETTHTDTKKASSCFEFQSFSTSCFVREIPFGRCRNASQHCFHFLILGRHRTSHMHYVRVSVCITYAHVRFRS